MTVNKQWMALALVLLLLVVPLTGCDEQVMEEIFAELGFDAERMEELEADMEEAEAYAERIRARLTPQDRVRFDSRLEEEIQLRFGDLEEDFENKMAEREQAIDEKLQAGDITEEEAFGLMLEAMVIVMADLMDLLEEVIPFMNETLDALVMEFDVDLDAPPRPVAVTTIRMHIGVGEALVGAQTVALDQPPVIVNGRTLVPLRFIGESLGAEVGWDGATQSVTYQTQDTTILLTIDSPVAFVNGEAVDVDVPPTLVNGRTLVPVRFVSEAMGFQADWDPGNRRVTVSDGQ